VYYHKTCLNNLHKHVVLIANLVTCYVKNIACVLNTHVNSLAVCFKNPFCLLVCPSRGKISVSKITLSYKTTLRQHTCTVKWPSSLDTPTTPKISAQLRTVVKTSTLTLCSTNIVTSWCNFIIRIVLINN